MKDVLRNILKPVKKDIYSPVLNQKLQSMKKRFSGLFHKTSEAGRSLLASPTRRRSRRQKNAVTADRPADTRMKKKKLQWWRDKHMLAVVGISVAAAIIVISVAMPGTSGASALGADAAYAAVAGLRGKTSVSDPTAAEPSAKMTESSGGTFIDEYGNAVPADSSVMAAEALDVDPTALPTTAPEPSSVATTIPDVPDLAPGCHDARIVEIQQRLMDLGYMNNDEPTDYYGNATKFALQLFQRKHSLQMDGLLGGQTMTLLLSGDAQPYSVVMGDRGSDVTNIQERLIELKYLKTGATGYFGEATETAVKKFQKRNGLAQDGHVGEDTLEILYSDDAKTAAKTTTSNTGNTGSSGSSGSGGGSSALKDPDAAMADKLIEYAKQFQGKEYTRGGKGPDEFDCSGFVYYCLNNVGYGIKYMTSHSWAKCGLPKVTSMSDLKKGDIICFRGHVGIYMGDGKMIHASASADKVVISEGSILSSKWAKRNFICGRRVF